MTTTEELDEIDRTKKIHEANAPHVEKRDESSLELTQHFRRRAVVIPEAKILFVPVPKSGCSSVMWALADIAGIDRRWFHRSRSIQPTRDLAIHDMDIWGSEHRLVDRSDDEIVALLESEGWFRFTVVREPVVRLWSAWQSKILLHEPQMAQRFASRSWWPEPPESAEGVLDAFHQFVAALRAGLVDGEVPHLDPSIANPHWGPQTAVLGEAGLNLGFVGRLDRIDESLVALNEHLRSVGRPDVSFPAVNQSSVPAPPAIRDSEVRDTVMRLYRRDLEAFDFEPGLMDLEVNGVDDWVEHIERQLPMVRALMSHNQRFRFVYESERSLGKQLAKETKRVQASQSLADRRNAELDRMRAELERASNQIEKMKSQLEQVKGAVEALPAKIPPAPQLKQHLEARDKQLERTNTTLRANYGLVRAVAEDSVARLARAEAIAADLESRLSWRLTKPLRWATDLFRRLRPKGPFARPGKESGNAARTSANPNGPSK